MISDRFGGFMKEINKNNSIIYFGLEPHIKKDFTNKLKQKGISYVYDEDGLGLGIDIK